MLLRGVKRRQTNCCSSLIQTHRTPVRYTVGSGVAGCARPARRPFIGRREAFATLMLTGSARMRARGLYRRWGFAPRPEDRTGTSVPSTIICVRGARCNAAALRQCKFLFTWCRLVRLPRALRGMSAPRVHKQSGDVRLALDMRTSGNGKSPKEPQLPRAYAVLQAILCPFRTLMRPHGLPAMRPHQRSNATSPFTIAWVTRERASSGWPV